MKFYTDDGSYDLVGNNTPMFFIRDASQVSDFIHSQKRMRTQGCGRTRSSATSGR